MGKQRLNIVDGANVAYAEPTAEGTAKVANLVAIRQALERIEQGPD